MTKPSNLQRSPRLGVRVAVCCSTLHSVVVLCISHKEVYLVRDMAIQEVWEHVLQCGAVCYSAWQFVAVCGSVCQSQTLTLGPPMILLKR